MEEEKYRVQLDNFQGPLDLLLHLIDKNKMDIYDIPIATITEQYFNFLDEAKTMDLDIASEFLLLAATLIQIKAKMLLPKKHSIIEDVDSDPREELVQKLLEYKFYKEAAEQLQQKATLSQDCFLKKIDIDAISQDFTPINPVANISIETLWISYHKVILYLTERKEEEIETITVSREEYHVEEYMLYLKEKLINEQQIIFTDLFSAYDSKRKIVTIFLALLELFKQNAVEFQQNSNFGILLLFRRECVTSEV